MKLKNINVNKVTVFFFLSLLLSISYIYSEIIYYIFGYIILFIFFKRPINIVFILLFTIANLYSNSYFVVTSTSSYKDKLKCYSSTAIITLDDNYKVTAGDIIVGDFVKDNFSFYKDRYSSIDEIKVVKAPLFSKVLNFRNAFSEHLFYKSGGKVSVAQALIFGDKRFIDDNVRDEYTISGLAHLLAMSGMHVGIIIAIFLTMLFFLPFKIRLVFAIFAVLLMPIFGGFSITVIRATIFSIIFMLTYIFDIKTEKKLFLQFIIALFLIFSPTSITDVSFLLSFGAVFGIIYLIDKGYNAVTTMINVGIAATLLTAPLSLYFFSMTNHLSILSTVIMSPVIYVHILFSILATISPIFIAPLIIVETFSNNLVHIIYEYTYFGLILKTIPPVILFSSIIFSIICMLSKYKWLSILSLLVIFYPPNSAPKAIFPALTGADKGFINFTDNRSEIFYQGSPNGFKYKFLPIIAEYGKTKFDYGSIVIFSGKNNYVKLKEQGKDFTNICINIKDKVCKYFYHTRSNSIKAKDIEDNVTHIIYKNKFKDESIIEINEYGEYIVNAEN